MRPSAFGPTDAFWNIQKASVEIREELDTDYTRAQAGSRAVGYVITVEYDAALDRGSRGLEASRSLGHAQFALANIAHARLCAVATLAGEWKLAREPALYATRLRRELFSPLTHLHFHHDIETLLRGEDLEPTREGLRTFGHRTRGKGATSASPTCVPRRSSLAGRGRGRGPLAAV